MRAPDLGQAPARPPDASPALQETSLLAPGVHALRREKRPSKASGLRCGNIKEEIPEINSSCFK